MSFSVSLTAKYLEKAQELNISSDDIEEKFTHGGGAGGQKINKTENTVFLKYLPLGITVKCQKHRVREANRLSAYKLLIDKIEDIKKGKDSERAQKIFKFRKQKKRRSKRAKEKMMANKKERGRLKESRRRVM